MVVNEKMLPRMTLNSAEWGREGKQTSAYLHTSDHLCTLEVLICRIASTLAKVVDEIPVWVSVARSFVESLE